MYGKLIVITILSAIVIASSFWLVYVSYIDKDQSKYDLINSKRMEGVEYNSYGSRIIIPSVDFVPNGEYKIESQSGIDSYYDVGFEHIENSSEIKITYCLNDKKLEEAKKYTELDEKGKEIAPYLDYKIPATISASKETLSAKFDSSYNVATSVKDSTSHCIELIENPYLTDWIKLGENSTVIISDVNQTGSIMNNVTGENYPLTHMILNDSSLMVYYPFDVNYTRNKNITYDYSGNHNDGTVQYAKNSTWSENTLYGGNMYFPDPKGSYITASYSNTLNISGAFTLSLWVKQNSMAQYYQPVAFGGTSFGSHPYELILNYDYLGGGVSAGFIGFRHTNNAGTSVVIESTTGVITDNNWHHIAITRPLSNMTGVTIYLDGFAIAKEIGAGLESTLTGFTAGSKLYIGKWDITNAKSINGSMDEIMIFNRSLSSDEISAIYNNQTYRFETPASQIFENISVEQDGTINRVNVTINSTIPNGANLSLRLREFAVGNVYNGNTTWQDYSNGDMQTKEFTIQTSTYNVSLEFNFGTDAYNFFSPVLRDNIIVQSNVSGGEPPIVDIEYPQFSNALDDNGTKNGTALASFSVNITSTNGTALFQINGTNYTASNSTALVFNISLGMSNGTFPYQWISWSNGTNHYINQSIIRYYTYNNSYAPPVDTTPPTFSVLSPTSMNVYKGLSFSLNVTSDDTDISTWWYSLDNNINFDTAGAVLNQIFTPNTTVTVTEGSDGYYINVSVNDTSNNINSALVAFVMDNSPPYFTLKPGATEINYSQGFGIDFNADDVILFGGYSINWTTWFTINQSGYLKNTTKLGAGIYRINVTINDSVNNYNSTIYVINVSKITPVITISGTTPITYGTITDVAGSGCPAELTCSLDKANRIYGAGTEAFNYSTGGNGNYTTNSANMSIVINKATGLVYSYINGSRANKGFSNGSTLNMSGKIITGLGTIKLSVNSSIWNIGTGWLSNESIFDTAGTYAVNTSYIGDENYTGDEEIWTLTISLTSPAGNATTTVTSTGTCRYKKLGYYNLKLPWVKQKGCI